MLRPAELMTRAVREAVRLARTGTVLVRGMMSASCMAAPETRGSGAHQQRAPPISAQNGMLRTVRVLAGDMETPAHPEANMEVALRGTQMEVTAGRRVLSWAAVDLSSLLMTLSRRPARLPPRGRSFRPVRP